MVELSRPELGIPVVKLLVPGPGHASARILRPAMGARRSSATIVFLGPTLPLAEARALLPAAQFRPPVAMGDVYRLVRPAARRPPARIAIIDGLFEQVPAVWHKEMLYAMERGVEVSGAASMGALRAAELHPFGMIGVGPIFTAYRAGRLEDDDEVAVAHGPARFELPALLRGDGQRARRPGAGPGAALDRHPHPRSPAGAGEAQFYRDRTWETVLAAGRAAKLPASQLRQLAAWIERHKPDRKAADARLLLRRLARTRPVRPHIREPLARTWFWQQLTELAPLGEGAGGVSA